MRICIYTETALPKIGGQEMVVDALARQFHDLGHDVIVLAPRPRLPLRPDDANFPYPVVRHPRFFSTRYLVAWYRWWLLRLQKRQRFDILHCHGVYPPGYLAALCRDRLGIPTAITSHGGDVRDGNVRLAKAVLHRRHVQALDAADALIAISRFTHEGYRRLSPEARRIVTIPNGVDLEPYSVTAARPAGLDGAIRPGEYVLFLGRLKNRKGVDLLIDALAHVPANGRVQLVIAGDGEERTALQAQAERLGLNGRIRFVGSTFAATKTYLLQNALCTAMPSREWEAFPLVVLESFAAGTPVLATRVPGLEDLIQPDRTGWLVPQDSVSDLALLLHKVLEERQRLNGMREQARQAAQAYSWRKIAERHLGLYEELRMRKHAWQSPRRS
jgi:glycosyltransferase involved in cell wall biosynthesis